MLYYFLSFEILCMYNNATNIYNQYVLYIDYYKKKSACFKKSWGRGMHFSFEYKKSTYLFNYIHYSRIIFEPKKNVEVLICCAYIKKDYSFHQYYISTTSACSWCQTPNHVKSLVICKAHPSPFFTYT